MRTALYFDTVNFASRIKAPVLAGMGFIDTISPPAGIFTMLNQIPGPVEALPMIESEHDNLTPAKGTRARCGAARFWMSSGTAERSCRGRSSTDDRGLCRRIRNGLIDSPRWEHERPLRSVGFCAIAAPHASLGRCASGQDPADTRQQ